MTHHIPWDEHHLHDEETTCDCGPSVELESDDIHVMHTPYKCQDLLDVAELLKNGGIEPLPPSVPRFLS